MDLREKMHNILAGSASDEAKISAILNYLPGICKGEFVNRDGYPVSANTRQHTIHDGSNKSPTKGDNYGIIAIDQWGVEHHSKQSDIPHSLWSWTDIIMWRYDDATYIEMMSNRIVTLE